MIGRTKNPASSGLVSSTRMHRPPANTPDDSMAADIKGLLAPAWRHGFFLAALRGLAATFFSDYRRLRSQIGLTRYAEADMLARLSALGYVPARRRPNFGFNDRRMTFVARPAAPGDRHD